MTNFLSFGKRLFNDEDGATAIEYGLLAALIAVGIIAMVSSVGDRLEQAFTDVDEALQAEGVLPD